MHWVQRADACNHMIANKLAYGYYLRTTKQLFVGGDPLPLLRRAPHNYSIE